VHLSTIGLGGCFVDTSVPLPDGETLYLEISIAENKTLLLQGIIAYVLSGIGVGLSFGPLSNEQIEAMNQLIA
jgi:hypothetical protein